MKKAIGYTRISVEDEKSISLDYQQAAIQELCDRQGLNLLRIETDEGISGATIKNRPAVQRVLQAVESGEVAAVAVFKSDRMSRDGIESLQIEKLMLRKGVAYLSSTEGNLCGDTVDSEFMSYIRAGLNQREKKLISLRTRAALQRKKTKGERLGRPRFGWRVVNGGLIPDAREQEIISRMRTLKTNGCSSREIVRTLAEEGFRTRKGTCFTQTQVVRIWAA